MRFLWLIGLSLIFAGCISTVQPDETSSPASVPGTGSGNDTVPPTGSGIKSSGMIQQAALPDLGLAPELNNEIWLNTDQPLRLAKLRGKVVLLDMWTFG